MNPLIESLGWTLIHFLWQASAIAALLWIALRFVRAARCRYPLSGGALLAMLACAAATAVHEWRPSVPQEKIAVPRPASEIVSQTTPAPAAAAAVADPSPTPASAPSAQEIAPLMAPAAPSQRESADAGIRAYLPWVVALWAVGVVAFSFRFLRSWLALRRLRSGASPFTDENTSVVFARLLERMGLRRPVALLSTAEAVVPMVLGWLRPAVIVPAALFVRLPAWQVEAILAHELAHVRRHDYLVNLLQNLVETVFFYHPAVWWVSGQLRKEREHCCDDAAAATCGGALDYARALTALEEMRAPQVPAGAVSAAGGALLGRIRRLLGVPARDPGSVFSWPIGIAVALLAVGLLASVHFVQGEDRSAADTLPDAPPQAMAAALLKRWQQLEETESPLPESRVAGIRTAIAKFIAEESTTATERAALTRYQLWHADRTEHSVADLTRLLDAIAALKPELVQLAFNREPRLGRKVPQDASKFGPAAASGLRASWSISPNKDTYVFGDVIYGYLTLWNSGEQTLMTGNGQDADSPGLRPEPKFEVRGEDGRVIAVTEVYRQVETQARRVGGDRRIPHENWTRH